MMLTWRMVRAWQMMGRKDIPVWTTKLGEGGRIQLLDLVFDTRDLPNFERAFHHRPVEGCPFFSRGLLFAPLHLDFLAHGT